MKFALLALALTVPSFAQAATLVCNNGQPDNDTAIEIKINPKSRSHFIDLQLWETFYDISAAKVVKNGNTIAIVGQTLTGSAEGETIRTRVDALLIYNPKTKKLSTTLAFDGFVSRAAEELNCR